METAQDSIYEYRLMYADEWKEDSWSISENKVFL